MVNGSTTIFLLGATGYIGSSFLVSLGKLYPHFPVFALVRTVSAETATWLRATHPNLTVVKGTLDDVSIIEYQAERADIVINLASCDHGPSSTAILSGMGRRSSRIPDRPPLLLHISGCGCLSDDARGQAAHDITAYSDLDLDLKLLPEGNPHLEGDLAILETSNRKLNPIRTIIIFPAVVYGVGEGIQKVPTWVRIFLQFAKSNGHSGTFGPGYNSMSNIHVKDVASAIITILTAALQGRTDEGHEGLYFVACNETRPSWFEITSVMGDYLCQKGILRERGSRPFSKAFVDSLSVNSLSSDSHTDGWLELGSNQYAISDRLTQFGWDPTETMKVKFMDSLKDSLDVALD